MSARQHVFEYALLRVVPRVDRGEAINAGVLLYCRPLSFLGSRTHLDADRLRAIDPSADPEAIGRALHAITDICTGGPAAGQAALDEIGKRFRWLTAPRSTVVQTGPVHTGLTSDPGHDADRLLQALVLPVSR